MTLKPGSRALILLLALLTSMGPLSTDMYLPSLPAIAEAFATDAGQVQLTLSVFLVGFALGQIIYGPVADLHGRKPVLLAGLALFIAASIGCMVATSIGALIAARFIQAVGACAAIVLARAIVRDLHTSEDSARILSLMGALMGLVPALAPILGAVLEQAFGWRASFGLSAGLGVGLVLIVAAWLPETLPRRSPGAERTGWSARAMMADFGRLAGHARFRRYTAAVCLGYGGLFAFISGSSFVLQGHYGLDEMGFGLAFATAVIGYIAGTLIAAACTRRIGIDRTIAIGTIALAAGGASMAVLVLIQPPHYLHVLAPMVVYMAGVGLALPSALAGAITPFPERAGTASSLVGFTQMTFAALVGVMVGNLVERTPDALAWTIGVLGVANLALTLAARGPKAGDAAQI